MSQKSFSREETLYLIGFFLSNYRGTSHASLEKLSADFQEMERLSKQQTYSMVMFLEMFKELNELKYTNSAVYKVMAKYPSCDKQGLQIEEVVKKLQSCQDSL